MSREMTYYEKDALQTTQQYGLGPYDVEDIEDFLQQYGLYHKEKSHQVVFCTKCRQRFRLYKNAFVDPYEERDMEIGVAKHGETSTCPRCGANIIYLADGRGRTKLRSRRNFVVLTVVSDDELVIRAVKTTRIFKYAKIGAQFEFVDDPEIFNDYEEEVARYHMKIGEGAMKFTYSLYQSSEGGTWERGWKRVQTLSEPNFNLGAMQPLYCLDNTYTVLHEDALLGTKFQYILDAIRVDHRHRAEKGMRTLPELNNKLITVLAEYSVHPQIEYMIKAGYSYIVESKLKHEMCGLRLNWKTNDLKKVLGLSREEIKLFVDNDILTLVQYKELRKLDPGATVKDAFDLISEISYAGTNLFDFVTGRLMNGFGETCRSILRYCRKQSKDKVRTTLIDYSDYLKQCDKLEYDMNDLQIRKPADLHMMHERLTNIIKVETDKATEKAFRRRFKETKLFNYTDEEFGLCVIAPTSLQAIVQEGKDQCHCVATYAQRHAKGILTILFVRQIERPETAYYTMEIDTDGRIVQCRGYKNNRETPKPESMERFEEKYEKFAEHQAKLLKKRKAAEQKKLEKKIKQKMKAEMKTA